MLFGNLIVLSFALSREIALCCLGRPARYTIDRRSLFEFDVAASSLVLNRFQRRPSRSFRVVSVDLKCVLGRFRGNPGVLRAYQVVSETFRKFSKSSRGFQVISRCFRCVPWVFLWISGRGSRGIQEVSERSRDVLRVAHGVPSLFQKISGTLSNV